MTEFDGEPEESRHGLNNVGKAAGTLALVADAGGQLHCRVGAIPEAHQRVGKGPLGVHRDVASDIVEDIRFGQVIHSIRGPDGDGGRELAAAQAIEEEEAGHVAAHRLGLKSGQWRQPPVDVLQPGNPVGRQRQSFHALQKVVVGVALPARADAREELGPGFMIFLRIQFVRL